MAWHELFESDPKCRVDLESASNDTALVLAAEAGNAASVAAGPPLTLVHLTFSQLNLSRSRQAAAAKPQLPLCVHP